MVQFDQEFLLYAVDLFENAPEQETPVGQVCQEGRRQFNCQVRIKVTVGSKIPILLEPCDTNPRLALELQELPRYGRHAVGVQGYGRHHIVRREVGCRDVVVQRPLWIKARQPGTGPPPGSGELPACQQLAVGLADDDIDDGVQLRAKGTVEGTGDVEACQAVSHNRRCADTGEIPRHLDLAVWLHNDGGDVAVRVGVE